MSYDKKGVEWFNDMPADLRLAYLANITDDQLDYVYNMQFENFASFLSKSFIWDRTPQGFDYWLEVSKYNFYEAT